MNLAKNLKELRAKKGVSQQKVADTIGRSRSNYSAYETRVAEPSIRILIRLSKYFRVSLDKLIR